MLVLVIAERGSDLASVATSLWTDRTLQFLVIATKAGIEDVRLTAQRFQEQFGATLTLLPTAAPQARGSVQRLGYRYALDAEYDFVVLLDARDPRAGEQALQAVELWRRTAADVVLAPSPLPSGILQRLTDRLECALAGRRLTFAGGVRGYSAALLKRVPFEINSADASFDVELLLQACYVGAKIEQIDSASDDELSQKRDDSFDRPRVGRVLASAMQFKLHQFGMLCTLKYRDLTPARYGDKTTALYTSHAMALRWLEKLRPRRVLDIGCGSGHVAKACRNLGSDVTGIDLHEPMPESTDRFFAVDIDREALPVDALDYDAILLLDVIEHLAEPERFLLRLRNAGDGDSSPTVLLTTPNVAFAMIRLNLLLGRFNYAERGILDITHKRLFTRASLRSLLRDCGYDIERIEAVPVPFDVVMPTSTGRMLARVAAVLARAWPTMFAFQFLVVCRPQPGVQQLLRRAETITSPAAARAD